MLNSKLESPKVQKFNRLAITRLWKFDSRLKKKPLGAFSNIPLEIFCCRNQKILVIQSYKFHIWKLYNSHFFDKNKLFSIYYDTPTSMQEKRKIRRKFNYTNLAKCMKFV